MSTLPKSIQAQMGSANDGDGSTSSAGLAHSQDRIKDFLERYKQMPEDFLRIPLASFSQAQLNEFNQQQQFMSQQQSAFARSLQGGPLVDMIDISVVEAQLVKNYGLLRMDLYCKIRVGHMVCETHTCLNGAKNPKWDGVYQFSLKPGIDSFHLEIYDENQFKMDEKIAWLYEQIPPEVFQGITVERWFPLSGRLGPNKEGSVLLVLSHKRVPMRASNFGRSIGQQHHRHQQQQPPPPMTVFVPVNPHNAGSTMLPPGGSVVPVMNPDQVVPAHQIPAYVQPMQPPAPQQPQNTSNVPDSEPRQVSDEDIDQLSEMFPAVDKAIIRAVLENNHNDKEAAIGALLALG